MPGTKRPPISHLREAIDCLPRHTRVAMLAGVRGSDIIVGAYSDRRGGVCPMLAAHRRGGRTSFVGFARAWDRFAGAGQNARRATEREVLVLVAHLEASLLAEQAGPDLTRALGEHRALLARRERDVRPGDPDRSHELAGRPGWRWLRPFRRLDEFETALALVRATTEGDCRAQGESEAPQSESRSPPANLPEFAAFSKGKACIWEGV